MIDYYKKPTWVWVLDYGCGMVKETWWIRRQADPKRRSNELLSALKKTVVSHHETQLYGHLIEQHSYYNVTMHSTTIHFLLCQEAQERRRLPSRKQKDADQIDELVGSQIILSTILAIKNNNHT